MIPLDATLKSSSEKKNASQATTWGAARKIKNAESEWQIRQVLTAKEEPLRRLMTAAPLTEEVLKTTALHLQELAKEVGEVHATIFQEVQEALKNNNIRTLQNDIVKGLIETCHKHLTSTHVFPILSGLAAGGLRAAVESISKIMQRNLPLSGLDTVTAKLTSERFKASVLSQTKVDVEDLRFIIRGYFRGTPPFFLSQEYARRLQSLLMTLVDTDTERKLFGSSFREFTVKYGQYLKANNL